jgi:DNA-binding response OmpR family regulator
MGAENFCVLFLDDQKDSTAALTTLLERRDFQCHHAVNSQEATEKLERLLPHLLIVDVNLGPTESGLAWLEEVRKGPYGFIPAIVLTGSGQEQTIRDSIRIGIDDFIVKPSEPKVLIKKIMTILARLRERPSYSADFGSEPLPVRASLNLQIAAISETGLCLSSHIVNRKPLSFFKPKSSIFEELGVSQLKKLTLYNSERSVSWGSTFPIRNFCQANGWTEIDFKQIRLWIRKNKLGRNY